jgi:hypothetical protein
MSKGTGAWAQHARLWIRLRTRCSLAFAGLLLAAIAQAQPMVQQPGDACSLPEVLQAWSKAPASIPAVAERRVTDTAGSVNQPYRVSMAPCTSSWCKPGSHAAMVKIDVPHAGRWRVALDTMMWIDVWAADAKLEGVLCEHHGCQPLRKIVQYDLKPGAHWVVVEGRNPGGTGVLLSLVRD